MQKFSLRYQLVLPFVFLVLLVPATVGWMLFDAGSKAVNSLTSRVLTDVSLRINEATGQHLDAAMNLLNNFAPDPGLKEAGQSFSNDLSWLEHRIWAISGLYQKAGMYTYFGGADGRFIGLYRINGYINELYLREPNAAKRTIYAVPGPGVRTAVLRTDEYDPRLRPWYAPAARQAAPVWSAVYRDFTSKLPTITVAKSIRKEDGAVAGVVAVDVEMKALTEFLDGLTISKNGIAFVMDGKGQMIASSNNEELLEQQGIQPQRLLASEMKSPLIKSAAESVMAWKAQKAQAGKGVQEPFSASLKTAAGMVEVAASPLGEKHGLDWVTVVVAPRSDFLGGVTTSFNASIGFAIVCVGLALLIGMLLINRVLRDILALNAAAQKIGIGEPVRDLDINRRDEIGQLARSFNEMEHNLRTDKLTGVFNREFLFTRMRLLRQIAGESEQPPAFALLFIDLDEFKPVNDHFGHDAGDRVLQAVSERLKAATRSSDIVVRYGGDEFVVLLGDVCTYAQVAVAIDNIRASVEQKVALAQGEIDARISIGWAIFPEDGSDTETLLKTADERMFGAKKSRKAAA
ncbi:MAG: diguanylate cyclase [Burkholderiaceae bacterium]|nr:diguanylate cyclase [Burkholderiaceae bacterium]